jgi:sugar/nucleoside kinase (ribokinase family)
VAIALKRLGFTTGVFAEIGDDELAARIEKTLRDEQVETGHINRVKKRTSFTVGLNFQKERTLFTHHVESPHEFDFSKESAKWVYLASLGKPWKQAYEAVVSYKKRTGAQIACNPGQSQFVAGRDSYLPILKEVDVLFLNKQEAQIVADLRTEKITELLEELSTFCPGIIVITDGRNGSYSRSQSGEQYMISMYEEKHVIERTGAGDAYAGGFLAGLLLKKGVPEAMQWGALNAGSVVTEFGGISGLLHTSDLEMLLTRSVPVAKSI